MSYNIPQSPPHPEPNEEVKQLPSGQLNIDLNPDLQSDDDSDFVPVKQATDNEDEGGFIRPQGPRFDPLLMNELSMEKLEEPVIDKPIQVDQLTKSFEEAYELATGEFESHDPISDIQQSKLVNYLDEELLKIQRLFVKTQSGEISLTLDDILHPILTNLQVIWLSISVTSSTNVEYFIKVLNDLEDYLAFYKISNPSLLFSLLQFIDVRLSYLYDIRVFSPTGYVRTLSIITRLRILVLDRFSRQEANNTVEVEISKVFEGLLERS